MNSRKRGMFIVVVILFLVGLSSGWGEPLDEIVYSNNDVAHHNAVLVFGEDDAKNGCNPAPAISLVDKPNLFGTDEEYKFSWKRSGKVRNEMIEHDNFFWNTELSEDKLKVEMGDHSGGAECTWNEPLSEKGCYIFANEMDGGDQDDCVGIALPEGYIIDQTRDEISISDAVLIEDDETPQEIEPQEGSDDGDASTTIFDCDLFSTVDYFSFICADKDFTYLDENNEWQYDVPKKVWLECSAENVNKYINMTNKDVYQCQYINQNFIWVNIGELDCDLVNCELPANKQVCENNGGSWIDFGDGANNCCGNDGISELGEQQSNEIDNYICLKNDPELVGSAGGVPCDSDKWCWVGATGDSDFQIFTIKKPFEIPYDVVSNNNKWVECKGSRGTKDITSGLVVDYEKANRFYCYFEGNRWSWAVCGTELDEENGIKEREAGDGLFALEVLTEEGDLPTSVKTMDLESYESFYGDLRFDIDGYDYLEFMVKFDGEPELPADVTLTILGPTREGNNLVYFKKNVLPYATNTPLIKEGRWIHIRAPLEQKKMLGVEGIKISGSEDILVEHVYLSRGDAPLLCSDEPGSGEDEPAWFDVDFYDDSDRNAEEMCNEIYDPDSEERKAWLGKEGGCCGDDENEYYSSGDIENGYGCWNSQFMEHGDTAMNVEFGVEYFDREIIIDYSVSFAYYIRAYYGSEERYEDYPVPSQQVSFEEDYRKNLDEVGIELINKHEDWELGMHAISRLELVSDWPNTNVYLFNTLTKESKGKTLTRNDLVYDLAVFDVIAETDLIEVSEGDVVTKQTNAVYACSEEECVYSIPGLTRKIITNSHPELYELWFKDHEGEFPVGLSKTFYTPGNLITKKVSQQVIFDVKKDEETGDVIDQGFYGCQAADLLLPYLGENNLPYCSIKGDKFCAHQDGNLVNSWSGEDLTRWGYTDDGGIDKAGEPVPEDKLAKNRSHPTNAVPGRNFVPNAEFTKFNVKDLAGWEIIVGEFPVNEKEYIENYPGDDGELSLIEQAKLKSERIAVPQDTAILFTAASGFDCAVLRFYDKNGQSTGYSSPLGVEGLYFSEDASYLTLEFEGECEIKQPMLQIADDLEPEEFSYEPGIERERRGAACCPENYCWNGYVCVEDMSGQTDMTEKVGEEREYRCIAGVWKHMILQWNWYFKENGFCSDKSQCFITGGSDDIASGQEPEEFYGRQIPNCINSEEYIFDHYCNDGKWSSRTKLLAAKLLEAYGGGNFVLYCTNPLDSSVEYEYEKLSLKITDATIIEKSMGINYVGACFDVLRDNPLPRELLEIEENICSNNICVLRFEEGGEFKTALATTINHEDALRAFGIASLSGCPEGEGFVECDSEALGLDEQLWYSSELEAIVYGKEGVDLEPGVFGGIIAGAIDWFSDFFGSDETPEEGTFESFIGNAINFNDLFLLNVGDKKIMVKQELFSDKEVLTARYENFTTRICEYLDVNRIDEVDPDLFPPEKISCTEEGDVQTFIAMKDFDFFWPQLTGKLRVSG